jgi:hypothetical protein
LVVSESVSTASSYGWSWFKDEIQKGVAFSERYCGDFLALIEDMDRVVAQILARPTSPMAGRPQDYVVSILVVRAFRLTVSALYIGLGGYPDSAANLERTIWEISIRLLDMTRAPSAAALGFLLDGVASEVAHMKAELSHRQMKSEPVHHLPKNIERAQTHYDSLARFAKERGFDPEKIRNKHGRLNLRQVCKDFGVEKAYLVDYALGSAYVHEKNAASSDYVIDATEERKFNLGPVGVPGGPATIAIDVLMDMARVLTIGTRIVDDADAVKHADEALQKVLRLQEAHESRPGWPKMNAASSSDSSA